ncbi:hypothetical protein DM02DRAFT_691604 [Periconia macrospinosa]|uniref:Uncharacterized protein n=1 Tax=Periconia macrospinosa TaxID=97972 RepID=A0A2V1E374_9PLEO|nr:hypothetical protein DM02DRAFT_691604 [Periconia macrospinosa]
MDDLKITPAGEVNLKLCFVGDGACGKTSFLLSTSKGVFHNYYIPTVFEIYTADFEVQGVQFNCAFWDTAGQDDYDRIRRLSYPDTHVICICFEIGDPDSFENILDKWDPEVRRYKKRRVPIFLLGFKKDLRNDPITIGKLEKTNRTVVSRTEAEEMARKIGAVAYLESSAVRHEGTKETFKTMFSMILEESPELKKRYAAGRWRRTAAKLIQLD